MIEYTKAEWSENGMEKRQQIPPIICISLYSAKTGLYLTNIKLLVSAMVK